MSIDNAQPGCDCPTCQIARAAPSPALTREALAAALETVDWLPFSTATTFDHLAYADAILAALEERNGQTAD